MIPLRMILALFLISGMGLALTAQSVSSAPANKQPPAAARRKHVANPGEVIFQNNCHRCHNAPQELSPRITGTVLQHMRVRANLSGRDERLLLDYLAP